MKIKACCREYTAETRSEKSSYDIALIGNPNVGKTLIFNHLTGSRQKVANFPGITVTGKKGYFKNKNVNYQISDLSGMYGFNSNKREEKVTQNYIMDSKVDLIINVVDASKLERNLFLTLQLLELGKSMIIIFNFVDKVDQNHATIDFNSIAEIFNVPIIPIFATNNKGFPELKEKITLLWVLSITGPSCYIGPNALHDETLLKQSWIFVIGDFIQPAFNGFGWDSRLVTALIFGFIAKEIVIASLGLIYGVGGDLSAIDAILSSQFTPLSVIALMLYVLVYTPCIGTYFALKQEVGKKWANFSVLLGLSMAWLIAFITIFIGRLVF